MPGVYSEKLLKREHPKVGKRIRCKETTNGPAHSLLSMPLLPPLPEAHMWVYTGQGKVQKYIQDAEPFHISGMSLYSIHCVPNPFLLLFHITQADAESAPQHGKNLANLWGFFQQVHTVQ